MSQPVQLLKLSNDNLRKQIEDMVKKAVEDCITTSQPADISQLTTQVDTLTRKLDRLINYLEKWVNVGNLTMNDIKQHV